MTESIRAVSVYEGFFSGGARFLHTDVLLGLQGDGMEHSVVSIHEEVYREETHQPMHTDHCYRMLTSAGIAVTSLGRRFAGQAVPDMRPFSADELDTFVNAARDADVILSLKEQPLRLLRQAGAMGKTVLVCLHRSDPEHQGGALDDLHDSLASGAVAGCTISGHSAKAAYAAAGIPNEKIHVIPNGIDLLCFKPSAEKRARIRQELEIPPAAPTVIYSARFEPMKNVPLFISSARIYLENEPDGHIIMCGAGMRMDNPNLCALLDETFAGSGQRLLERVRIVGIRRDREDIYAAGDVISLTSSYGETSPLVLLEGMACGIIPVATDVGDTGRMLQGGRGIITSHNATQIAAAWQQAHASRKDLALTPEQRLSIGRDVMVRAYGDVIRSYI